MNFSQQQADPRRHLPGIAFVVLFHALIVWALVSGLAKKVVEVVRVPIETKVIEEIKKPPPPPEVIVPPPKLEAPPPPFIPPPEVQVVAPPPPEPTITATTPTPPATVPFTPVAPPAAAPAAAPAAPVQAGVACSKMVNFSMPTVPAASTVTSGNLIYLATVKDGKITSFEIASIRLEGGNDQRVRRSFIANAEAAVRQYVCSGNAVITQEFVFKLE